MINQKKLIKSSFASRYELLPKEVKDKVSYVNFVKNADMIETVVETCKNVVIGRKELRIKYGNFNIN